MQAVKRGSDKPIDVKRVRRHSDGELLPDAVVTYKFYDRANEVVFQGAATLLEAETAWFQIILPKAQTEDLELMEHYRLDIIFAHTGKEIAYSYDMVAVDYYAPN